MSLNESELEKLQFLSKIKLGDNEKLNFIKKFNNVLNLIDKINDFDTTDCKVLTQVVEKRQELREDKSYSRNSMEDIFLNSQNTIVDSSEKKYFSVPKTIK
ncbi:MAG: Asp-tRNA(Asn)/Glu-tRNA(Gln) amidotransferase subunit GatC [Rickettsia sp.]|nr:Asp-tRNA(Asn)/Glu-tRNA(Gln) amidotransferase subunit GatC [Rickettsia sp.]